MSDSEPGRLEDALRALIARGRPLALIESCTGGALCAALTGHPGASQILRWGLTLYDHASKSSVLGLSPHVFIDHGSVSSEAVTALAAAAHQHLVSGLESPAAQNQARALAISGIAGPGGGSQDKPVGLCWMALADTRGVVSRRFCFSGTEPLTRSTYREQVCREALGWLLE